jgi:hypothetical protein
MACCRIIKCLHFDYVIQRTRLEFNMSGAHRSQIFEIAMPVIILNFVYTFFDSKQTSLRNAPSYSPSFFPQHTSTCLHTTALLLRAKLLFHSKIVAYKMQPAHPNTTFLNFLHKEHFTFDQSSSINYHFELHL